MSKRLMKIIIAIITLTMLCGINSNVFATQYNANQAQSAATGSSTGATAGTSTIGVSNGGIVGTLQPNTSSSTVGKVTGVSSIIIGILQVIGVAAAIIMLVFLGIKYVSAAPSEKADIKKSAAIYVVGAVMLLGSTVILGWIEGFINNDLATIADVKTIEQYIHLV